MPRKNNSNKMHTLKRSLFALGLFLTVSACSIPKLAQRDARTDLPATFRELPADSANSASLYWKDFFGDPSLEQLIDTALVNNQELNITLQNITVAQAEVRARRGEYLPFVNIGAGAGFDKVGRYTNTGALEANTEIRPGSERPDPLPNFIVAANASWEIDIWRRLRNAKQAAVQRYVGTIAGKNFVVTNLIAEVAKAYYELLALDNQLLILTQNIQIQTDALSIVRLQKQAARVTELAVRRFEALVLRTQSMQFDVKQQIVETENRINFLLARYPQPVARDDARFDSLSLAPLSVGVPAQLLFNRPDVIQAEQELVATKLDVKSARARFYPALRLSAAAGFNAFNPAYLLSTPESMLYNLGADLFAPLINRNAIKAAYITANARQIQALYDYERTLLNAHIEVVNNLSKVGNLGQSYGLKAQQVEALNASVSISNNLFRNARADYMEVLLTQRDALEARFDLVETKREQLLARISVYQALGGGWR
jgi:NodT family efflux transporter outer membrane factor (OMF) lipoprotein